MEDHGRYVNAQAFSGISPADRGEKVKVGYIRSFIVFPC